MKSIKIETERFYIRPLQDDDAQGILALDGNPKVHTYLGKKTIKTLQEATDIIQFIKNQYKEFGIGRWAIIEKETNDFVGWTGIKYINQTTNNYINYYDFGYRLKEEYWGKGVATETGIAIIAYAKNELKLKEIYAICDINNLASKNVLHKCGFTLIEQFAYDNEPHFWFSHSKNV